MILINVLAFVVLFCIYKVVHGLNSYYIATFAGNGGSGSPADGAVAQSVSLSTLNGVYADTNGVVYLSDSTKLHTVSTSGILGTFAGGGAGSVGEAATSISLSSVRSVWGSGGTIYIGDNNQYKVYSITNGIISLFAGNGLNTYGGDGIPATSNSMYSPYGIYGNGLGTVYIALNNGYRVVKIVNSLVTTAAGSGSTGQSVDGDAATSTSFGNVYSVCLDTAGNIYFGESYNRIRIVPSSGIVGTFVGTYVSGTSSDGMAATSTSIFSYTGGLWFDTVFNLFYSDTGAKQIKIVDGLTGIVSTVAGTGSSGLSGNYGKATAASFSNPIGLYGLTTSTMYFADNSLRMILALTVEVAPTPNPSMAPTARPSIGPSAVPTFIPVAAPTVYLISAVAGSATSTGTSGDNGPATSALFPFPGTFSYVYQDSMGVLYHSDGRTRIRKISVSGIISAFLGTGGSSNLGDGGQATAATIYDAAGIWGDSTGKLYAASDTYRIRVVDTSNIVSTFAGTGTSGFSGDGGPATSAMMAVSNAVSCDTLGSVYFLEYENHRLRIIPLTGIVSTIAGTGLSTSSGDGGPATSAGISSGASVSVDSLGVIYFAEQYKIRTFGSSQIISLFAGTTSAGISGDGFAATSTSLKSMVFLWKDAIGTVFVSDYYNNNVRMIASNIVYTVAGNGYKTYSNSAGMATSSPLNGYPHGLCGDTSGDLYITDLGVVRRLTPLLPTVSPSVNPTVSSAPSASPSYIPTESPTFLPSAAPSTTIPSQIPSIIPTKIPTMVPSIRPTVSPTITFQPSMGPSTRPTFAPVIAPTFYAINAYAGIAGSTGSSGDDGPATSALLYAPSYYAYVFLDSQGSLYHSDGANRVRKISASGIISAFFGTGSGSNGGDGTPATSATVNTCVGVWGDSTGRVFVLSTGYSLRMIDTSGIVSTYAGTGTNSDSGDGGPATSATFVSSYGLAGDTMGVVYFLVYSSPRLRMIDASGIISTLAGNGGANLSSGDGGPATSANMKTGRSLSVDTLGQLYFADNAKIRLISTTRIVKTVAGMSSGGTSGDGFAATSTSFQTTIFSWTDTVGTLFISDQTNVNVRMVISGIVYTAAGNGNTASSNSDGLATSSPFAARLNGLCGDASGNLFITDLGVVRKLSPVVPTAVPTIMPTDLPTIIPSPFPSVSQVPTVRPTTISPTVVPSVVPSTTTPTTQPSLSPTRVPSVCPSTSPTYAPVVAPSVFTIGTYAGITANAGYSGDNGPATSALLEAFGYNYYVFLDSVGNLYHSGGQTHLRRISSSGIIYNVLGTGLYANSGDGGPATSASVNYVAGVWCSTTGNVFVLSPTFSLRLIDISGIAHTYAGTGTSGDSGYGGQATSASFGVSFGLSGDSSGTLYFQDTQFYRIRLISALGIISHVAGSGSSTSSGDGGPATSCGMGVGYTVHADTVVGALYFGDQSKIRSMDSSLIVSAFAGTGIAGTTGDGFQATSTNFKSILMMWKDSVGTVYISDKSNYKFRMVVSSVVYTVAGSGLTGASNAGGLATSSPFAGYQGGICGDTSGNLFVTDYGVVRKLTLILPTAAPTVVPTKLPTVLPSTVCPTVVPTDIPSESPTLIPSSLPTFGPTHSMMPTVSPSSVPTFRPTKMPSYSPSDCPSTLPTLLPTVSPSLIPSEAPSVEPSLLPSNIPSLLPTDTPSLLPTFMLTLTPSCIPTASPSSSPTEGPSVMPSGPPSCSPSNAPICEPSIPPTVSPTVGPSVLPTFDPSIAPSTDPSMLPSACPTCVPTVDPSSMPSIVPSMLPSACPTCVPTVDPSSMPSIVPSMLPSACPTLVPSMLPSRLPTLCPSVDSLSSPPTVGPSRYPSALPSAQPALVTSRPNTLRPSSPSIKPTRDPTLFPTCKPTRGPTIRPTAVPSTNPTVKPTLLPTAPTVLPTLPQPSYSPSPTEMPSFSISPSESPTTANPTVSSTALPSTQLPSQAPSPLPSVIPTTLIPSASPTTICPSAAPSTVEYYVSHPKATLPSNDSISVISVFSDQSVKIVLPFFDMSSGSNGDAFTNVVLSQGTTGSANLMLGRDSLTSVNVNDGLLTSFGNAIGFDSVKRSVSVLLDINGDGNDDLIIGDPYASRCYVLYGSSLGLTDLMAGFTIFGEQDGDLTGWSVSGAGDVNNDTLNDIIIGAPFARRTGAVYVIYGQPSSFDVYLNDLSATQGFAVYGTMVSDYLGISVSSTGDMNKDGYDDIIAGALLGASYFSGAAFIVYGGRSLASKTTAQMTNQLGYKLYCAGYSYCGYSVSGAGDVNGDTFADVLVGSAPQKNSVTPSAYLIYGTASVIGNILLPSLSAAQGIKISGGGIFVSSCGDVNADKHADFLIYTNYAMSSSVGVVIYSNLNDFTISTAQPTVQPSVRPSTADPSLRPSAFPSIIPSRRPSASPAVKPPTSMPIVGSGEPSSYPTSRPSVVTIEPSEAPSEPPTVSPTVEPTEHPTVIPTTIPSGIPTKPPSSAPTVRPSTGQPTSAQPTLEDVSRRPFAAPTLQPTSSPPALSYQILTGNQFINESNPAVVPVRYFCNASEVVSIEASSSAGVTYTIAPRSDMIVVVWTFNVSVDSIDLTLFTDIHQMTDFKITAGSAIINLPRGQLVRVMNHEPSDMTESCFLLSTLAGNSSGTRHFIIMIMKICIPVGILLLVVGFAARFVFEKRKATHKTFPRRYIMDYAMDENGEYICKEIDDSFSDVNSEAIAALCDASSQSPSDGWSYPSVPISEGSDHSYSRATALEHLHHGEYYRLEQWTGGAQHHWNNQIQSSYTPQDAFALHHHHHHWEDNQHIIEADSHHQHTYISEIV